MACWQKTGAKILFRSDTNYTGFKTSFEIALRYTSRVQLFYKIRMNKDFPIDKWVFRPVQQILWVHDEGRNSNTDLDFDRSLSNKWLFRFVNNIYWNDQNYLTSFTNGPSLFHTIDERKGISYNFRVQSSSLPHVTIDNYVVSVGFRQLLYKQWFFWIITPAVSFPREGNFQRTPSLSIRFESVFGSLKNSCSAFMNGRMNRF